MDLQFEPGPAGQRIRECRADGIRVNDQLLTRGFLLTPSRIEADLDLDSVQRLDSETESDRLIERLLAQKPELVLLGSGSTLRFPPPRFQAALLKRGIGLETMDNGAAARTFNLLAGEGRRVVAVFLLPTDAEAGK